jgi:hypothetical protein
MPVVDVIWDLPDDPDGNVQHIAEHGLTPADVEHVLRHPRHGARSRSSGRPAVFGRTPAGEDIIVIYDEIDDATVYPVTAYQIGSSGILMGKFSGQEFELSAVEEDSGAVVFESSEASGLGFD